ncbi:hypothetical protein [Cellulomonas cellasea]|uniref:Uncharacterized protein n=2 Tax=Cellulomonas cellasea TaxID=43670 RepID=A0A0A0B6Q9_9CELL|nr:hypothetical protein [Cellulomonas cellasea]KGM01887.1 hypothetical protein Q760_16610 [Cellulomonas cellasea DSM 20118]GEA86224.1 hypothetical protein CCE01nite_01730 [Cellulomonas cellasea]
MSRSHRTARTSLWRRAAASPDDGAGSLEYLGATMFVALIVGSLLMVATPLGNQIGARLCAAIGTTCGSDTGAQDDLPPDEPCTVRTDDTHIEGGVSISFISLGSSGDMSVERLSDGTYKVTVGGELGADASLSAGEAQGTLRIGDYGGELGAEASVSGGVFAGAGVEYSFDSKEEADEFTNWVERTVAKEGAKSVSNALIPGSGASVEVLNWLWNKATGYDYEPPAPNVSYYEGGISANGSASAGAIVAGGNASLDYANALGVKFDHDKGTTTVYNKITLDGEAAAQLGLSATDGNWGAGGEGSAGIELVVATTLDKNNQISEVSFDGAATAEGAGSLTALAGIPLQGGGGKGVQLKATVPVTDANRAQVTAALGGLGAIAAAPGGTSMVPAVAIPMIMQQAAANGDVTAQFLDVNSSNLVDAALGLEAPAIGGLSFSLGASTATSESTGAYYLGANGWQEWAACAV